MEKKVVKLGVVGLGRGFSIAKCILNEKDICLHSICDKDPERLKEAMDYLDEHKKGHNIKPYGSFEEILASDVEALIIATDKPLHTNMAIQAMNAGKHVLSEIPTIASVEEAKLLRSEVKKHPDLIYMAGENACFTPYIMTWKTIYESGAIGEVAFAESEYLHHEIGDFGLCFDKNGNPTWRASMDAIEYLTHNLGPILYVLDDECVSVSGFASDIQDKHGLSEEQAKGLTGKGNMVAMFKTKKGTMIKIFIGFGVHVDLDHNFSLYGTKGTLETDRNVWFGPAETYGRFADLQYLRGKVKIPVDSRLPKNDSFEGHGGCDVIMVKEFVRCCATGEKPDMDVDKGIQMSICGVIANESAKNGSIPMEIPTFDDID